MCDCNLQEKIHNIFPYIMEGDYDTYMEHIFGKKSIYIDTNKFSQKMENIEIMCPEHHPFFKFLIENKLNLESDKYAKCIIHAWNYKPYNDMRLLWHWDKEYKPSQDKLRFGLKKAWKMFKKDTNANVRCYYYDCGGAYSESEDEYDGL